MRTTRLPTLVRRSPPLLLLPSLASANCYSIYDAKNRLAFQSTVAPVDLSTRISESMRARFPGGHLIMIPDDDRLPRVPHRPDDVAALRRRQHSRRRAQARADARGVAAPARHGQPATDDDARTRPQRQRPQRQRP